MLNFDILSNSVPAWVVLMEIAVGIRRILGHRGLGFLACSSKTAQGRLPAGG
jgi:hypothetical protein